MGKEIVPKRILALDIDQTLAGGVVPAHIRKYNRALDLGMTIEQESGSDGYPKTFDVPHIQQWRSGGPEAEARFQAVRANIRTSPDVHLDFRPLSGSSEGVVGLIGQGFVLGQYYTVRPKEVESATKQWLVNHQFPDPERVVICDNHVDKLKKILGDWVIDPGDRTKIVLIDDSLQDLVVAAQSLVDKEPELQKSIQRLTLVGFGITDNQKNRLLEGTVYPEIGLRVFTLPSWQKDHLNDLINSFKL